MHTAEFIRTTKFDKSMSGYRVSDVEMFLEEIADDFDELTRQNKALADRVAQLTKELEQAKGSAPAAAPKTPVAKVDNSASMENVQGILVSAQRFSDQIINEANEKAAAILDEANHKAQEIDEKVATVLNAFEKDIAERKASADAEVDRMLTEAAAKSEGLVTAAHDSVARQQLLFDKLKVQVSEFKKAMFENHKQQLEVLQKFPDSVPYDPERAAKAIAFEVESEPDFKAFLPRNPEYTAPANEAAQAAEPVAEPVAEQAVPAQAAAKAPVMPAVPEPIIQEPVELTANAPAEQAK